LNKRVTYKLALLRIIAGIRHGLTDKSYKHVCSIRSVNQL